MENPTKATRMEHHEDDESSKIPFKMFALLKIPDEEEEEEEEEEEKEEEEETEHLCRQVPKKRRKLLVLDINGLLADIVMPPPQGHKWDTLIFGRAIFKRPFCDDFLRFCFQNFDVGLWTSRTKKNMDAVVSFILGNLQNKLLFCWDSTYCTDSGFKTIENSYKPMVFKEMRKIWGQVNLAWKKGDYDKYNSLLIDDSPYKALLNPDHTALFPYSYHYNDKEDNSLGSGGDLRVYLEGLLAVENVPKYVERYRFGQPKIDKNDQNWKFYSEILHKFQFKK